MSYTRLLMIIEAIELSMKELRYTIDATRTPPPSGGYAKLDVDAIADLAIQYYSRLNRGEVLRVLNTPLSELLKEYSQ